MIIWQGLGFLVVGILAAAALIVTPLFNQPGMAGYGKFADAAILFLAAFLTLLLGLYLKHGKGKAMIDEATGERVEIKSKHTLFFIPILFWPVIFAGLGIRFLFAEPSPPKFKGALIRPLGHLCGSEKAMQKSIAAISASSRPVNYDKLIDPAERLERLQILGEQKGCGIIDESAMPVRLETNEMREEEHAGRNWRVARVYLREMGGETLKISRQIQDAWIFHLYANEEDAFIELDDRRKW